MLPAGPSVRSLVEMLVIRALHVHDGWCNVCGMGRTYLGRESPGVKYGW